MAEKLEDLNLPNASVAKIIKDALPESVFIGKDARSALSRAASVFILYVTSQASSQAQKVNRKTLLGQDIIAALEELEFESFVEPLQEALKEFKEAKPKKATPSKKKSLENGANGTEQDESQDIEEKMEEDT